MMPTLAKRRSGLKAKKMGDLFEKLFSSSCARRGVVVTRIPDGCKQLGGNRLIRVRTPFDWVLTYGGRTALIDTKTCDGRAFRNSSIDENQLRSMLPHELRGTTSGYVVWLREEDWIMFIPASVLAEAILNRGSISPGHKGVIDLGSSKFMDAHRIFGQSLGTTLNAVPKEGTRVHEGSTITDPL